MTFSWFRPPFSVISRLYRPHQEEKYYEKGPEGFVVAWGGGGGGVEPEKYDGHLSINFLYEALLFTVKYS